MAVPEPVNLAWPNQTTGNPMLGKELSKGDRAVELIPENGASRRRRRGHGQRVVHFA
ncbi:hypothetical protein LX83_005843 [Goodfellowiella coeruleoviolacea]|uniref:Uncharacterized protein n=1 Tax=Goodfellowiella coeruleoviolacea TaxID=334858 RepID=A0AAE3GJZ5_9PSEU|nr:hypothetical protein [Goodfellowiella coeruleoviolacea]